MTTSPNRSRVWRETPASGIDRFSGRCQGRRPIWTDAARDWEDCRLFDDIGKAKLAYEKLRGRDYSLDADMPDSIAFRAKHSDIGTDDYRAKDFYKNAYRLIDDSYTAIAWRSEDRSLVYLAVADRGNELSVLHFPASALEGLDSPALSHEDLFDVLGAVQDLHVGDAYAESDAVAEFARRRERELGDTADPSKVKKTAPAPKSAAPKREQAIRGLGRVDFSGLGYGWGMQYYPDSLSVDAIGIDYQSGERNAILNFSPITHAIDLDGRKFFCHETTMGYDRNADSWSGATIGPDFWTFDGEEAREFAENIGFDRLAARACAQLGIDAPGLKGREALPIPKAVDVAPEPGAQAEAAKAAAGKKLSGEGGGGMRI